jgi:tRNA (guanine37-N1)-methyltransferase
MLQIDIITLFPEMFAGPFSTSIVGRAVESGLASVELHQLRDFATDRHHRVDDTAFGGGPGMVLKAEPLISAVRHIKNLRGNSNPHVVLLSPQGRQLKQGRVIELGEMPAITLVCGHYEGVDQRFIDAEVDEEISIGDYVLTGGEIPAMVLVDAMVRLQPGALGDADSAATDSFSAGLDGLLQGPIYTRPERIGDMSVPDVLLSGDHVRIEKWRREQSVKRTRERRQELLEDWPE